MDDSINLRAQAMAALSEVFFERACLIKNLGTMEPENQHSYRVRTDSFLRAWSLGGASDMACIIACWELRVAVPRMTCERSMGKDCRKRYGRKELSFYTKQGSAAKVVDQPVQVIFSLIKSTQGGCALKKPMLSMRV